MTQTISLITLCYFKITKRRKVKLTCSSHLVSYQSIHNMSRPMPLAVDLVVINSDLDSGFMVLPFLLSEEEQYYLITQQFSKLITHFFCNSIHALPRKLLVNLQTKQSLPNHIPFSLFSCALSLTPR